MTSTSRTSGNFTPIILEQSERIRLLVQPEYVRNNDSDAPKLKFTFFKQRKSIKTSEWETESDPKPNLTIGELRRLELDSECTEKLLYEIERCKALLEKQGFQLGKNQFEVRQLNFFDAPSQLSALSSQISNILGNATPEWLELLKSCEGDGINQLVNMKLLSQRSQALQTFQEMLQNDCCEEEWHQFFYDHKWIFGHAMCYQFLHIKASKPLVGGKDVHNQGGQMSDFLTSTSSEGSKYTGIIEIKTPATTLLRSNSVRNKVYPPSSELCEAVAQTQSNINTWNVEGSRNITNVNLRENGHLTVNPRSILIIGNTTELKTYEQREAFEIYRRNMKEPDILTL
jgi:hypothetical protein